MSYELMIIYHYSTRIHGNNRIINYKTLKYTVQYIENKMGLGIVFEDYERIIRSLRSKTPYEYSYLI